VSYASAGSTTDSAKWLIPDAEMEGTLYQRLVFDFFCLNLLQKREIAGRLGLGGLQPDETDFDYSKRVLQVAEEAGTLTRLADLVRQCHSDILA
jgi:hypothetical protein